MASPSDPSAPTGSHRQSPTDPDQAILEDTFSQLARLAYGEGEIDRREARLLSRWGRRNGIPGSRMRQLLAQARGASEDPDVSSRDDLELLVLMALVDGFMSSRELRIMRRLAGKVGVGPGELEEMVMRVEATAAA